MRKKTILVLFLCIVGISKATICQSILRVRIDSIAALGNDSIAWQEVTYVINGKKVLCKDLDKAYERYSFEKLIAANYYRPSKEHSVIDNYDPKFIIVVFAEQTKRIARKNEVKELENYLRQTGNFNYYLNNKAVSKALVENLNRKLILEVRKQDEPTRFDFLQGPYPRVLVWAGL